jgi:hypothetical protein
MIELVTEYASISDKGSLYARVLMSLIKDREEIVRRELERQAGTTIKDREHRARARIFARTAPLERLLSMYADSRP